MTMDHGRIRLGADPKLAIACGKKDTVKSQGIAHPTKIIP
jgi:hypothetical protein